MKFTTNKIRITMKTIAGMDTDYCYLDVPNGKFYTASDRQAMRLDMTFTDVREDERKVFVLGKNDFLHIASFANEIEMNGAYRYASTDGAVKGKFENNETYSEILSSISYAFEKENEYIKMFEVDQTILTNLTRSSIFVDGNATNPVSRNLNIKDGSFFSSSDMRIYLRNNTGVTDSGLVHADVLKFVLQLGTGTIVFNNSDSYLLKKDDLALYFSTACGVDYLPVNEERFRGRYMDIFKCTKIKFDTVELIQKLGFMSFYAKSMPNTLSYIKITDGKVYLSTNSDNTMLINDMGIEYNEGTDGEFVLPFNLSSMQSILAKLGNVRDVSLFFSARPEKKLFILQFSDDEFVILAKINV